MQSKTSALCQRFYGWLLKAYPAAHRAKYGEAMAQLFRDLCRDTLQRQGRWGLLKLMIFTLSDTISSIVAEQTATETRAMLKRILTSQISTTRTDRSIGPLFILMGAGVSAMAVHKIYALQLDETQFWIGILAAMTLGALMAALGLVMQVMKVWNVPTVQYRRVPGQMLRYYINAPGLCYCASILVLLGSVFKLAELRLSEAELLLGLLISMALSMLCVAIGLLLSICKPPAAQPVSIS